MPGVDDDDAEGEEEEDDDQFGCSIALVCTYTWFFICFMHVRCYLTMIWCGWIYFDDM